MAVRNQEVDNCSVIYSNHLLIVSQLQGSTGLQRCKSSDTHTALSGSTLHFINKTILLHRPIILMCYFVLVLWAQNAMKKHAQIVLQSLCDYCREYFTNTERNLIAERI